MPRPAFLLLGMAGLCWAGFFLPSTLLANGPHDVLALAISTYQSKPGHAVRLLAQSASAAAICATGFGQTFWLKSVADDPSRQEGFLAVPFTAAGGYHSLTLTVVAVQLPPSWCSAERCGQVCRSLRVAPMDASERCSMKTVTTLMRHSRRDQ